MVAETVFVVTYEIPYDKPDLIGVFSSKEKAEEVCARLEKEKAWMGEYIITIVVLDEEPWND